MNLPTVLIASALNLFTLQKGCSGIIDLFSLLDILLRNITKRVNLKIRIVAFLCRSFQSLSFKKIDKCKKLDQLISYTDLFCIIHCLSLKKGLNEYKNDNRLEVQSQRL